MSSDGSNRAPLAGITIIDLTRVLAGPFCTLILSQLGARVIKVERPGIGDDARLIPPLVNGQSLYFASINHGKESIALDLTASGDRDVFERLLVGADVLVENYRPGTMARLGYGWAQLHERFPRLIYAAVSGFGQDGPYARRPAYDMVVQALGGIMSITGAPDGAPTRVGTSIGDIAAALYLTIGIEAALLQRGRDGQGSFVDIAMLDCQVAILENALATYCGTGRLPGPLGSRHPAIAPFQAFATADGFVVIAAGNPKLFARLCAAIERPELSGDARFDSVAARMENVDALEHEIEAALQGRTTAAWLDILQRAEVPCAPINTLADVVSDPQIRHRRMIAEIVDPTAGPIAVAGCPIQLSSAPTGESRRAAPSLDGDRGAILAALEESARTKS